MTTTPDTQTDPIEPAEVTPPLEGDERTPRPEREAARYRKQLRDAEAERDALATRVESLQRAEVERIAGRRVTKPSALWASGIGLADVLDEAGNVDPAKVDAAAAAAADGLGLSKPARGPVVPNQGDSPSGPAATNGFASAFGPSH